jgi:hypothetical protein
MYVLLMLVYGFSPIIVTLALQGLSGLFIDKFRSGDYWFMMVIMFVYLLSLPINYQIKY